jgi:predicted TIM-barrel fold metal-dependent hydrolase
MFSTDYPHPEGGRDPLAKFEEELGGVGREDLDLFFRGNMAALLGLRSAQSVG